VRSTHVGLVLLVPVVAGVACVSLVGDFPVAGDTGAGGATSSAHSSSSVSGSSVSGSSVSGSSVSGSSVSGSSVSSGSVTGTGTGGSTAGHAEPPGPGPNEPGDAPGDTIFAISKLYLGDTDPDGTTDHANGWKNYGYDLDGDISTPTSTTLCKPLDSATPANVYPDGNDGIDNSFGKLILPILFGISSTVVSSFNTAITDGKFTMMLDMHQLGSGANYNPLVTDLFAGGDMGAAPKFDGSDLWPVRPEFLVNPTDITSGSKYSFPTSYVTGNTWVSGPKSTVVLDLPISLLAPSLTIHDAVISVQLDPTHKHGSKGVIAGVLITEELTAQIKTNAGSFDSGLCSGTTLDMIILQITQASDILHDGTQDPSKPCDAISIGLGFDAEIVKLGPIAPAQTYPPNQCPDAG
jgi:hypothetical protein